MAPFHPAGGQEQGDDRLPTSPPAATGCRDGTHPTKAPCVLSCQILPQIQGKRNRETSVPGTACWILQTPWVRFCHTPGNLWCNVVVAQVVLVYPASLKAGITQCSLGLGFMTTESCLGESLHSCEHRDSLCRTGAKFP